MSGLRTYNRPELPPTLTGLPAAKLLKQPRSQIKASHSTPTPPPDLLTYWQARYPRYQLAPHIRLMLEALNDLGDGEALIMSGGGGQSRCR